MSRKYLFLSAALLLLSAVTVMAQNKDKGQLESYNFVEVQGGVQFTATDMAISKLLNPMAGVSVGRFFTPAVGLRLNASGWEGKSGYELGDGNSTTYKWNYITSDVDLMVNLSNLVCKNYDRMLNVMFIGGVGLTTAWNNDATVINNRNINAWDGTKLVHNIRTGLRLETNVTKPLGVSLEVLASSLADTWNSKHNNSDDWQFSASLGLVYRFGRKFKEAKAPVIVEEPAPVVEEPAPAPVVKPEPTPVVEPEIITERSHQVAAKPEPEPTPVVKEVEKLHEENFYALRHTNNNVDTQMKRVKEYMERNPDAKIIVVGYADKGTGNPRINKKYAAQRARKYKDTLVKDYGCDSNRIIVESKGDSVQPFSENDKNRCVIVDGPVE